MYSMEKEKNVLISTIYEGKATKVAITKLSIDKLILLVDDPINKTREKTVSNLKKSFGDVIDIETLKTPVYEMSKIINKVKNVIEKESKKNKILLHISEGRKITSLSLLFAGYLMKDKVNSAYYITEEENKIISLPMVNFKLGESKTKILREIKKGNNKPNELINKLSIKQSAIYQHIQELKEDGYLEDDKELKLTNLGRIMTV